MKILSMAWTIYDSRLPEFCDNYSGGGLAIKNICEYIGRKQESYLFIGCRKLPEMELGNIHIVGTNFCSDIEDECSDNKERHLRSMTQAFEAAMEQIVPDIVNFHGIGILMQRCIEICVRKNIPYVYTDHLFIGSGADIKGYSTNTEWEKDVYNIPNIKVIAVSTGMKRKILQNFPHILPEDIHVIKNGTDFSATWEDGDLQQKYGLKDKKVLLCVGTVNYRKNQSQIIKAFQLLPSSIQNDIKVIFCGKDKINGELQESITKVGLQNKLIYAGAVSSDEMKKYYSVADGLIMPSYAEGLSIAALEAIAYGLPVIMFSDSECAEDLDDQRVVCLAEERTDGCLARTIEKWYGKEWDKQYIIAYSKYFTMERVAEDYIAYYEKRLEYLVGKGSEMY